MPTDREWIIDPALKDPDISTKREREIVDLVNEAGSVSAAERQAGVSQGLFARSMRALKARAAKQARQAAIAPKGTPGFMARELTTAYDADGNVLGEWLREGPEPPFECGGEDEGPARDGTDPYFIKGVSTYFDASGSQRGQWVKTSIDLQRRWELVLAQIEGAKEAIPRADPAPAPKRLADDLLTVYPVGDSHCGLYAWEAETGTRFDLEEFERINQAAFDRAVEAAPSSSVALINFKGDETHADNNKNRTPRSGHELDVHGRHGEVVRVSVRVKRYQINTALRKHGKVIVRIDPGNHDPETALTLALLLEAIYENEPRVEVVTSPNPYWYFLWGSTLIGTCHGDGAKGKDLPLLMATDCREWWSQATYCVWFVGHLHHKDIKEYNGCDVEYVATLAASDRHHHGQGYRSRRTLQSITYHKLDEEVERQTQSLKRIERLTALKEAA